MGAFNDERECPVCRSPDARLVGEDRDKRSFVCGECAHLFAVYGPPKRGGAWTWPETGTTT